MLKIEKPRLICGILGEIAFCKVPVEIAWNDRREHSVSALLALDIEAGFRKARIQLTDVDETKIFCKAEYFGNTIFFTLTKDGESKTYPLPKFIEADHWYIPEITLPRYEFPTDICYPHGGLMGFAVKLTPNSVVIAVDSPDFLPPQTSPFHITFRHRTKNESIFHSVMDLEQIGRTDSGFDLTFHPNAPSPPTDEQRIEYPVKGISLNFETELLGTQRLSGWIQLETLGLAGFSGKVMQGTPADFLPKGLVLNVKNPEIRFTLELENNGQCYFQVVDSGIDWWDFVQFHTDKRYGGGVAPEHLVRLFTESAAIRGKRRSLFGKHIAEQIPFVGINNPELSIRVTFFSKTSSLPSAHVGFFRFTDHSYLWQEGCVGNLLQEDFEDIWNYSIRKLNEYHRNRDGMPKMFLGIYKPEIRRNADYHDSLFQQEKNTLLKAFYVKRSDVCNIPSSIPSTSVRVKNIDQLGQHERLGLSRYFPLEILSVLDFWNPSECNSITNGLLKKLCRCYGTELTLFETDDASPLGLVFRHRAWLATSATGLLAASFVFPIREITLEGMLHLVKFAASHAQYAIGSNEILVIGEPEETANWTEILNGFSPVVFHCGIGYIG